MLLKKILASSILILSFGGVYAQRFSQYQTGTLYESFENPSRAAFIPDSSRKFAANFFIPNLGGFGDLSGNAQVTLKSRMFTGLYESSALNIGSYNNNYGQYNFNTYSFMIRMFGNLKRRQEIGLSFQTRSEGRARFTDEAVAIFDSYIPFTETATYANALNAYGITQSYHQLGLSYRENLSKQLSVGIKLSALMGIYFKELNITSSNLEINRESQRALLSLTGKHYSNFDTLETRDLSPTFRNLGAAVSLGTSYRFPDGSILQGNIKDLGFITWNRKSDIYNVSGRRSLDIELKPGLEDSTYRAFLYLVSRNSIRTSGSITRMINGRAELMYSRSFDLPVNDFKYKPTLVLSKDLAYDGFAGALVNHVQYQNYWLTLTTALREHNLFDFGAQLMYQSPNVEFYVGSERLFNGKKFIAAARENEKAINSATSYTGADFFLGFSLKFGHVIEHPMNANRIPTGEAGFFKRLYGRFFKTR
jgi:hypothetical protein